MKAFARTAGTTVFEVVTLGIIAVAIAFAVNGVRASGSVRLARDYFPKADPTSAASYDARQTPELETDQSDDAETIVCHHPFHDISFEDVLAVFKDPNTAMGVNVFVDARSQDVYEEGHIPGAIQADHYRLDECIEKTLDHVECAEKVIVYCNGGSCEDSLFLCRDLAEFDVPENKLYVYHGGWEEWTEQNMPIAAGPEPWGTEG